MCPHWPEPSVQVCEHSVPHAPLSLSPTHTHAHTLLSAHTHKQAAGTGAGAERAAAAHTLVPPRAQSSHSHAPAKWRRRSSSSSTCDDGLRARQPQAATGGECAARGREVGTRESTQQAPSSSGARRVSARASDSPRKQVSPSPSVAAERPMSLSNGCKYRHSQPRCAARKTRARAHCLPAACSRRAATLALRRSG